MVLDPKYGMSPEPMVTGETLVLTNLRVALRGIKDGRETVVAAPLYRVEAAEVRHTDRSYQRLHLSTAVLAIGVFLAVGIWLLLGAPLLALLIGGVIASVGMWLSAGFLLDEDTGHVCFFTNGKPVRLPLHNRLSTQAAYDVVNRFFELTHGTNVEAVAQESEDVPASTHVDQLTSDGATQQDSGVYSGRSVAEDVGTMTRDWRKKLDEETSPQQ